MKKLSIILIASAFIFSACSNSAGSSSGNDGSGTGSGQTTGAGSGVTGTGGGETTVTRPEVSGKIGKYEAPFEVGDIVFNDGSAIPYSENLTLSDDQKNSAIAVIFYKGTGLNSDTFSVGENNAITVTSSDTTTVRTLGVGLKHDKSGLAWCFGAINVADSDAKAFKKGITTIQCTLSGSDGAYTFTGDKNGYDNLEQIAAFLSDENSGTIDDTTGNGASSRYPAFYFAKNYKDQKIGSEAASRITAGSEYESGWYLPSMAELFQIYANGKGCNKLFDIDAASEALGGDKFLDSGYWSSSQADFSNSSYVDACKLLFSYGSSSQNLKSAYQSIRVCAIREFN